MELHCAADKMYFYVAIHTRHIFLCMFIPTYHVAFAHIIADTATCFNVSLSVGASIHFWCQLKGMRQVAHCHKQRFGCRM